MLSIMVVKACSGDDQETDKKMRSPTNKMINLIQLLFLTIYTECEYEYAVYSHSWALTLRFTNPKAQKLRAVIKRQVVTDNTEEDLVLTPKALLMVAK